MMTKVEPLSQLSLGGTPFVEPGRMGKQRQQAAVPKTSFISLSKERLKKT